MSASLAAASSRQRCVRVSKGKARVLDRQAAPWLVLPIALTIAGLSVRGVALARKQGAEAWQGALATFADSAAAHDEETAVAGVGTVAFVERASTPVEEAAELAR